MIKLIVFLLSFNLSAQEVIHEVIPNQLIRSGKVSIDKIENNQALLVKISYKVSGPLIPKKYRQGVMEQGLPLKYAAPLGYEELEINKEENYGDYSLIHMGRFNFEGYQNTHKIFINLKSTGWKAYAYYSDQAPGIGWVGLVVILEKFSKWPIRSKILD